MLLELQPRPKEGGYWGERCLTIGSTFTLDDEKPSYTNRDNQGITMNLLGNYFCYRLYTRGLYS